jgi:hypothetical protein
MLTFTLVGRVGRIRCSDPETLEIAVASSRLVQGEDGDVNWVVVAARDQLLRSHITRRLTVGAIVRFEGEVEPRRREIKGVGFYDVVFVARSFEVLGPLPPSPPAHPAGEVAS